MLEPFDVIENVAHELAATDESRQSPTLRLAGAERREFFISGAAAGDFGFEFRVAGGQFAREAAEAQVRFDAREHFLRGKRLQDVIHRTRAEAAQHAFRLVFGGDEEHGNFAHSFAGLEHAADFVAVEIGRAHV